MYLGKDGYVEGNVSQSPQHEQERLFRPCQKSGKQSFKFISNKCYNLKFWNTGIVIYCNVL